MEREFGRLKNEFALTPLRTRGLERVRLHADLVLISRLGQALSRARALPLAAYPRRAGSLLNPVPEAALLVLPAMFFNFAGHARGATAS